MPCEPQPGDSIRFIELPAAEHVEGIAGAVTTGFGKVQKELPSWLFYDSEGSRLFEAITKLPEYYLTRCEAEILERYSGEIIDSAGTDLQVIEFGSGSSEKTRLLLRAAIERQDAVEYVPIDISRDFLRTSAEELIEDVPGLCVTALAGDYLRALESVPQHGGPRLYLFLGSTVGNFEAHEATSFLRSVRKAMRPQDRLLVGQDLKKEARIIEPAYNDASGMTERFNKNALSRINRELCGHFDLHSFEHAAPWVEARSRIEMRLISKRDQEVSIEGLGRSFHFRRGEYIHTENSHKWSPDAFADICEAASLSFQKTWSEAKRWFALHLLNRG